jgi:hypothetical protein
MVEKPSPKTSPSDTQIRQRMHGMAVHARIFLLGGFVSVENKGRCIYLPKLDVAGSIPVARSISLFSFS